ncbi:penicillin acylase family protein [Paractinoplanes atraurantiacus]|uniref:Penicillin amidase n=1 Tax=Paractinoplanes atraurantiacus TaxID=1036182 RepID=A0A285HQQ1_9ACTN|nr:penicillin acylase family protein [Actinoplanes atraurantiacus]SNY38062.1 penicillin amidase [Actinoplanes atraurantiacus]
MLRPYFALAALVGGLISGVPPRGGTVEKDVYGVSHVRAGSQRELFYLQGMVHAEDRMFQMDVSRRRASGTLAELIGSSALGSDVQMRALGLRRSAEGGLQLLSKETRAALEAYTDGVNDWLARGKLPGQYRAVRVTKVAPWTEVDSLVVIKSLAFSLSFDLDLDRTNAVRTYDAAGKDGQKVVFGDLMPFAPFSTASPVADATTRPGKAPQLAAVELPESVSRMAADYLGKAERVSLIASALNRDGDRGSNSWVIGGRHTANGRPILASDPHLSVEAPSVFHPIDLRGGGFDVQGDSLPGTPFVILGQNRDIAYGATQHFMDVTDTYAEKVEADASSPSGLSTVYQGRRESVTAIPETFRVNPRTAMDTLEVVPPGGAVPARTLIVPRRNNGPLLTYDAVAGAGISVQYTGFAPTAELETFRLFNLARNVGDFREAIQYFDVGGQHFVYADRKGTIAYFTNAEVPIREDLQAGKVQGNPPYLLRNGTGGNEWLPVRHRQLHQALPYEIVPFAEMPQVVNPPAGFIVSANNDPTGNTFDNNMFNQLRPDGGISYLSFFHNGFRGGRITDMVKAAVRKGGITADDVVAMQADTTALDAQYFAPMVKAAFDRAGSKDERIAEAAGRLGRWNHTYPTGLSGPREIDDSVAATIYVLWRGRFITEVFDRHLGGRPTTSDFHAMQALKRLVDRGGVGESGIDFFAVPGMADPGRRRDHLILKSLGDALDLAASDNFKAAFGNSADQRDYLWGKLHRITLTSPLGPPYSIPADGPGIPVDGGVNVPDVAGHPLRADTPAKFTLGLVPARRFVAQAEASGWRSVSSLPGGTSEDLGDPFARNLLPGWLANQTYPVGTWTG